MVLNRLCASSKYSFYMKSKGNSLNQIEKAVYYPRGQALSQIYEH